MYRINYGNGQVSGTFTTYKAALASLFADVRDGVDYTAYARIQRREDDEWFGMGAKGRPQVSA